MALVFGLGLVSTAVAQTSDSSSSVSEVVVTGSRLRVPNATSVSPVNTVSAEAITAHGYNRAEELVNTLPQAYADQGGNNRGGGNGASGTSTLNLRNLGNQRTLVLIDGKRLMPGDPSNPAAQAPDINNVPTALVQRVDVVTGGASAVYGSDAIAGVVNFVMKQNFEGLQIDAQLGDFVHDNRNVIGQAVARSAKQPYPTGSGSDGQQGHISLVWGKNFSAGDANLTAYVDYRKMSEVLSTARDYSVCNLSLTPAGYGCSLSSNTKPAQFQVRNPTTGLTAGTYTIDAATGNTFRPYQTADGYNLGSGYDLQTPDKRVNAGLMGHYTISPALELYGSFGYMHDHAENRFAPGATYTTAFSINCANPLLSGQQANLICGTFGLPSTASNTVSVAYRNIGGDERYNDLTHDGYRFVGGFKGDIGHGWSYDAYGQYGRTDMKLVDNGDFSRGRLAKSLRAVTSPTGQVQCESVLNGTDTSCVPLNLFTTAGPSQAALKYVEASGTQKGWTSETVLSGSATGGLGFTSPLATNEVNLAVGVEYRREALGLNPDSEWTTGDLAAPGTVLPVHGHFDVKEAFAETRVPLVQDKPFVTDLAFEGGIRYSDYSNSGSVVAYKYGGDWVVMPSLRLRGSFNRSVRAPNVQELYSPQQLSFLTTLDPCEGTRPTATLAQCQATGLTAAQYGTVPPTNGQALGQMVGGNPNLKPEKSNTITYGGQLTIAGVTASVDYFHIKVSDLIGTIPISLTLSQCVKTADPYFCGLIHRQPSTGSLVKANDAYISAVDLNTGSLTTSGVDVLVSYAKNLSELTGRNVGSVNFTFSGTYTDEYIVQSLPNFATYDCAGQFGLTCGIAIPKWRHRAEIAYQSPWNAKFSLAWRYIGMTKVDKSSTNPLLTGVFYSYDQKMKERNYFDFGATIDLDEKTTLHLGVNNLFDKDPPLSASTGGITSAGNFFGGMYDALGRYVFLGMTAKF